MNLWRRLFGGGAEPDPPPNAPTDVRRRAEAFWQRWTELRPTVTAALADSAPQRFENALCEAVAAVHPRLRFSVDAGQRAAYALVITGDEDPELRAYTDALAATAPPEDPVWEYYDHVPPVPDPEAVTVNVAEHRIPLAEVRVLAHVDENEGVVDVAVYHPVLEKLGEQSRATMTFLPLDATLGERLAGRRLRRVETALEPPQEPLTLVGLRELVRELDQRRP